MALKIKTIIEKELTEFGEFDKSKTVITEECVECAGLREELATWDELYTARLKTMSSLRKELSIFKTMNDKTNERNKTLIDLLWQSHEFLKDSADNNDVADFIEEIDEYLSCITQSCIEE